MNDNWTMEADKHNNIRQEPAFGIFDERKYFVGSFRTLVQDGKTIIDGETNAILASAAPEMLAVLCDLVRYHTDEEWRNEQESHANQVTDYNVTFLEVLIEKAKDAIVKAEPNG